jgi:hypothetical protein
MKDVRSYSASFIIGVLDVKFKLIFALFNGIVVLSFLFVFLMPLFVLGLDYTAGFWSQNWYLILVFVAILGLLDGYFIINWKLFQLLEKEDWKGLSSLLETRIFQKKRLTDQSIRLLCNAWVVQGKPLEIMRLEAHLRARKPDLVRRHSLLLGIPYLLKNETPALIAFFEPLAADSKGSDREWVRFNLAFGYLAERQAEKAVTLLAGLAKQRKEEIVQLLSLYLLDSNTPEDNPERTVLDAARMAFRTRHNASEFSKLVDKQKENLEVIILSKFINEAADWMFIEAVPAAKVSDEVSS